MSVNNFNKILGFSILAFSLASCATSFKTVYIEVAKPSMYILPNDIVSLTLMNRSMTDEFTNFPPDSLQAYFYRKGFDVNAAVLDSAAADTTLKVLAELLYESGRYDVVIPEDRNIPRTDSYYKLPPSLDWDYVSEICETYHTDALLVIERYLNKLMTNYGRYPSDNGDIYEATIDSRYDAIIKVYDPSKKEIIKQLMVDDTIYWAESDYSQRKLFTENLIPLKKALIETGIQTALELDGKLSPQWETQTRGYFVTKDANSAELESYIRDNNWNAAYDYWENRLKTENNSKTIQSKIEYNLAIASEMDGNIPHAAEWAIKSYETQYHKQTEDYLYLLKKRKKVIDEFKKIESN